MNNLLEIAANNEVTNFLTAGAALVGGLVSATDVVNRLLSFRLDRFREEVDRRAVLCRTKTGYIGALLARYTALITLNLLGFNIALNVASAAPKLTSEQWWIIAIQWGAHSAAGIFAFSVVVLVIIVFAISRAVMRQTEDGE